MKNLINFEMKKILRRKTTWITLTVLIALVLISNVGTLLGKYYVEDKPGMSKYEKMIIDRDNQRNIAGRKIDSELITEVKNAYKTVPYNTVEHYSLNPEYQKIAQKYETVYHFIQAVMSKSLNNSFRGENMSNISDLTINNFYSIRQETAVKLIGYMRLNNHSKEKLIDYEKKLKTPIKAEYYGGYKRYITVMYANSILCIFAIVICISPLFAGEYTARTDQIILTSKYGKSKLIKAKLITGLLFGTILSLIISMITYIQIMIVWGTDGASALLQLLLPFSPYSLTIVQVATILTICILMGIFLMVSFTMLLSSRLNTPFWVSVIANIMLFTPIFFRVTGRNTILYNMFGLLPTNMLEVNSVFSSILYEVGPLSVEPYIFKPIFALVISLCMLPYAQRGFKNHQVK